MVAAAYAIVAVFAVSWIMVFPDMATRLFSATLADAFRRQSHILKTLHRFPEPHEKEGILRFGVVGGRRGEKKKNGNKNNGGGGEEDTSMSEGVRKRFEVIDSRHSETVMEAKILAAKASLEL